MKINSINAHFNKYKRLSVSLQNLFILAKFKHNISVLVTKSSRKKFMRLCIEVVVYSSVQRAKVAENVNG